MKCPKCGTGLKRENIPNFPKAWYCPLYGECWWLDPVKKTKTWLDMVTRQNIKAVQEEIDKLIKLKSDLGKEL